MMTNLKITAIYRIAALCMSLILVIQFGGVARAQVNGVYGKPGDYEFNDPEFKRKVARKSQYLTMKDGVKLAMDYYLPQRAKPEELTGQLPAILYLTRYVRSVAVKPPFSVIKRYSTTTVSLKEIQYFVSQGYAVVVVDTRGSGASFGVRKMEFSHEEVADNTAIIDWIIQQPWSNGKVGCTGVSYLGTTAEFLTVAEHPAVKAIVPRHAVYDLYQDMILVNGMQQRPFLEVWRYTTKKLDSNEFEPFTKQYKKLHGIAPVDGDRGLAQRNEALKLHENNFDYLSVIDQITYRDDRDDSTRRSPQDFSYSGRICRIDPAIFPPMFWIGGWYDGALTRSSVRGFLRSANIHPGSRLLMGPWDHGPVEMCSPHRESKNSEITYNLHEDVLRFFDYHLKGLKNDEPLRKPIKYYTVGLEKWQTTTTWPPVDAVQSSFYLTEGQKMIQTTTPAGSTGKTTFTPDYTWGTGSGSRYNSQTGLYRKGPISYVDFGEKIRQLPSFSTEPFATDMELTGHPVVQAALAANATDASLFVYLTELTPDGKAHYITEGMFRYIHRKEPEDIREAVAKLDGCTEQHGGLEFEHRVPFHTFNRADSQPLVANTPATARFDCLPVSYLIRKGSRLQVSFAGLDADHFAAIPDAPTELTLHHSAAYPTFVQVPLRPVKPEHQ